MTILETILKNFDLVFHNLFKKLFKLLILQKYYQIRYQRPKKPEKSYVTYLLNTEVRYCVLCYYYCLII